MHSLYRASGDCVEVVPAVTGRLFPGALSAARDAVHGETVVVAQVGLAVRLARPAATFGSRRR